MVSGSSQGPRRNEYVVADVPGNACSILINLELVNALQKLARRRPAREINGILLGRRASEWNRTLIAIEDCDLIPLPDDFPEHLEHWRGKPERLSAVGLVRTAASGTKVANPDREPLGFFNKHFAGLPGALLLIEPMRGATPYGRLLWSSSGALDRETAGSVIPLNSSKLRGGEFTILQESPVAEDDAARERSGRSALRRWAWVPFAAALLFVIAVIFWPAYRTPRTEIVVAEDTAPDVAQETQTSGPSQELQPPPVPRPRRTAELPQSRPRLNRDRPQTPPAVTVELRAAPESFARRLINRVPGLPFARRFRSKDAASFVPPLPSVQVKPTVPTSTARAYPGEWQVTLRVTIDKSGRIVRANLLNRGAHREFVGIAKDAIDGWRFEPARLRDRPVPSALDVTFRFHNSVRGERVKP